MAENQSQQEAPTQDLLNNIYIWIFGAIILLIVGWFGYQYLIGSSENYKLTLVDAPKETMTSVIATFTWRIDGPPTTIHHTSVHLGPTSQPGELGKDIKPADTQYTEMVPDFVNGDLTIPLQFIGNIKLDKVGKYYYRAHASIKDKNYWSDEYSLEVKPLVNQVTIVDPLPPKEVLQDQVVTFTWRVDGPANVINHTAVHYGTASTPGTLSKNVRPIDSNYTNLVPDFANGDYNIPLQFIGNTTIATAGAYFYRAHAIIGKQNYWTDEYTLTVKENPASIISPLPTEVP